MEKGKGRYGQLFLSTLKISAFTFGGGFVIVPLMKKRFVEQLHWVDETEMLDMIAIAQSAPGPIAVNASILIGHYAAGWRGALATVLGTILPPLVIISLISLIYHAFRDNALVNMLMMGMTAGVAAVICDVVINMAKNIAQKKRLLPLIMLVFGFVLIRFLKVHILLVLLLCGAVGAADTLIRRRRKA